MKLNVGCGADSWGDVRVDIVRNYWVVKHRSTVNLVADVQYLPFRDKSFDELRIHQVLEHVSNWERALYECCRVTRKISITVPIDSFIPRHAWYYIFLLPSFVYLKYIISLPKLSKEHIWQFNLKTLKSILKKFGFSNIQVGYVYHPIFGFLAYGHKAKYFRYLSERLRRAYSWEIVAW